MNYTACTNDIQYHTFFSWYNLILTTATLLFENVILIAKLQAEQLHFLVKESWFSEARWWVTFICTDNHYCFTNAVDRRCGGSWTAWIWGVWLEVQFTNDNHDENSTDCTNCSDSTTDIFTSLYIIKDIINSNAHNKENGRIHFTLEISMNSRRKITI